MKSILTPTILAFVLLAAGGICWTLGQAEERAAQVLAPPDIPRFVKLGVIASMQPSHCTSDMVWAETRLGPQRVKGAYAWRSVLETGAHLPLSSDFPGETLDPFAGMYAAVTRQDASGKPAGGWYPAQRLTIQEALRGYTAEAAYAGFEEKDKAPSSRANWPT